MTEAKEKWCCVFQKLLCEGVANAAINAMKICVGCQDTEFAIIHSTVS